LKADYAVEYYRDEEGGWNARVPDLPGCFTCGDSLDDVREFVKEAMEVWLESYIADGNQPPQPQTYILETATVDIPA
jgi:antitoxin HicB